MTLRVATNEVGNVFQYIDYLPTGRPWVAGQNTIKDTPYLFAGGWTDTTYDLVNFGARWYEPRDEIFLSPEPLLEEDPYAAVDDPSLLSAYTYAASNPLRFVDADGRAPRLASTGFDLGQNYDKHQAGNKRISVKRRAERPSPRIALFGRNDAAGQQNVEVFQKHKDRADRFSTILSISVEEGIAKLRVFGITFGWTQVGAKAAPNPAAANPGPGNTGAAGNNASPAPPPRPAGAPPEPGAQGAGGPPGAAAPPTMAGGGGKDVTSPPPPPPRPPNAAAPAAKGPDTGN